MKFVLFHGAFGNPQDNWFPQLQEHLKELGQEVIVIQFPVEDWGNITKDGPTIAPKKQSLSSWMHTFSAEILPQINKNDGLCFIGHSLGCVFILHLAEKFRLQLDSAVFVSPFLFALGGKDWQFDHVNRTFYKTGFDYKKLRKLILHSTVVYSLDDPYVDSKYPTDFAQKMGSRIVGVKNGGHLNGKEHVNLIRLS